MGSYSDTSFTRESTVDLQFLNKFAEEIIKLEKDVEEAQSNFSSVLLECTASINSLRFKLGLSTEEVLKYKNKIVAESSELTDFSVNKVVENRITQKLQKELERNIINSGLSIKRSLMKFNNFVSHHNLLFLPFYELKAYYNQLLEQKRCNVSKSQINVIKPKLSYAEAIQSLEEISAEIEKISKGIVGLSEECKTLDSTQLDYLNFFTNEYKIYPAVPNNTP